ncbi:hypothetical protein [Mycobacterium vicinigordonae]|nr:hypothetical protein [Mycobacterium vicinigordonae]
MTAATAMAAAISAPAASHNRGDESGFGSPGSTSTVGDDITDS